MPLKGILYGLLIISVSRGEEIFTSKIFIKKIDPTFFNWTENSSVRGFKYRATLANNPDLPRWMSYLYSDRHRAGFIFGVPPVNQPNFKLDIIGINKDTYESLHKTIHLNVTEKQDIARYEVHLKVDNLNVQDLFDSHRLQKLLNIFMDVLWKSSKNYLYVTFLASAVKLGARLPLIPQEGEGEEFSEELMDLQEEVRPLLKFSSCPRDFKRTTVDRHFRSQGFLLDWCSFRLVKLESESGNAHYKEAEADIMGGSGWKLPDKYNLPTRDYVSEMLMTIIVPAATLVILWLFLSFVLCFQHQSVNDPRSDSFFDSLFYVCEDYYSKQKSEDNELTIAQYQAVQRATDTLRSMDNNRNTETSPRLTSDRMDTCRPNPPPYSATKRIAYSECKIGEDVIIASMSYDIKPTINAQTSKIQ
ncbi:epsilon-sarcoglycan isoform X2 [Halyomorpha halys]|uniref:epsilon-sarcoglycan isoform X2 n=1 Tax=Halyomorpha halys TaxID=286706 RepID=UPI0006D4F187